VLFYRTCAYSAFHNEAKRLDDNVLITQHLIASNLIAADDVAGDSAVFDKDLALALVDVAPATSPPPEWMVVCSPLALLSLVSSVVIALLCPL